MARHNVAAALVGGVIRDDEVSVELPAHLRDLIEFISRSER